MGELGGFAVWRVDGYDVVKGGGGGTGDGLD